MQRTADERTRDEPPAAGLRDPMLRSMRWQDLGNDDARLPPAFVVEFCAAAFEARAFARNGVTFPAQLARAVARRQAEFLAGRIAARHAVERLGMVASDPGIGPSREPLWQDGVTGSITHANDMAAAVALPSSLARGVGIDIERCVQADARDAIRGLALSSCEQALLESASGHLSQDMLLTIAFSAKESFFKGVFPSLGRYFDFDAARLSFLDVAAGRLTLTLAETLGPALPRSHPFTVCFRTLSVDTVMTSFVW